jgi:hypothetical protein
MDLSERPERPQPAGWVIGEFTSSGELSSGLHEGGRVWDDEAEAKKVVENGDRPDRPLVLYALVPAWGPAEEPTATVARSDPAGQD